MEIYADSFYPACVLSNFAPNVFEFEGVPCKSMEGLLQSFKFRDPERQLILAQLYGLDAKHEGRTGNGWIKTQMLYWKGVEYPRHSDEYQKLLDRAYVALSENENFKTALMATVGQPLTHHIGSNDPKRTILTRDEFIQRLTNLRQTIAARRAV